MFIILNYPPPTEGLHHVEPNVTAYFQNSSLGKGTLYIAESIFCWIANSGEGFSLKYQDIFIHAVSRDRSNFPEECLYLMINGNINMGPEGEHQEISSALNNLSVGEDDVAEEDEDQPSEMHFVPDNHNMSMRPEGEHQEISSAVNNLSVGEDVADIADEDEDQPSEMHFVPDNHNMLDVMFQALSDCQALNPDQEDQSDEDDDAVLAPTFSIYEGNGFDGDYGAGGDQAEYGEEEMNEEQFEDAEQ